VIWRGRRAHPQAIYYSELWNNSGQDLHLSRLPVIISPAFGMKRSTTVRERLRGSLVAELTIATGVALLTPLVLGVWLDALLGRGPVLLFAGGSIGILIGTIVVVRIAMRRLKALSEPTTDNERRQGISLGEEDRA
jgi:F0F1-type ATP synthase assembly protein I